ncbi:putative F-box/kelch-repeat protein At3g22730 [Salvia splendens]|uniref:putative F-box/kelch-repeat protein At3g22730 n=1 Tax=Salvia splendens TaxID=180675 RepID=UPI001C27DAE8|nr:putative F-box/kelch-repeat protein At3g22730 [Salvia splendens]
MKHDLYLLQEIWIEILMRLPIRSIARCKCVCKLWRYLVQSYTPKPGMAFLHQDKMGYAVCDEAYEPLVRFRLPPPHDQYAIPRVIIDSVNGLLLLWDGSDNHHNILFIVNPMTCEYIELPPLPTRRCLFGFGVSKLNGQYKILCVDESRTCDLFTLGEGEGEGLWRIIPSAATRLPDKSRVSRYLQTRLLRAYTLFFRGNLHWIATDFENNFVVCCFDFETDVFTSFSLSPRENGYSVYTYGEQQLCVLNDQLWACDIIGDNVVIWKMNNYQDSNSWKTEYTFAQIPSSIHEPNFHYIVFPLKVFSNGDLLVGVEDRLLVYSTTTKVMVPYAHLQRSHYHNLPNITHYTPSFLSLKIMGINNVSSLLIY